MDQCQSALLRVLMTNDGSMTVALESLLQRKITARVLSISHLDTCEHFPTSTTVREVVLESEGKQYLHAISHISNEFYTEMGFGTDKPIGLIMREHNLAQYRDVYSIEKGELSQEISEKCGVDSTPTFTRKYFVHVNQKPMMHLIETALPELLLAVGSEGL